MTVSIADLREDITTGQLVARYSLTGSDGGSGTTLARGTTIGFRRLARFAPTRVRHLKLVVETIAPPRRVTLGVFA